MGRRKESEETVMKISLNRRLRGSFSRAHTLVATPASVAKRKAIARKRRKKARKSPGRPPKKGNKSRRGKQRQREKDAKKLLQAA